jgi:uncharacterized protein (TIGR02118 family)
MTMEKSVDFMPRRPDISRAEFRDHYEQRHAPLALPLFPFRRYRRNHLIDQEVEPGFDCVSEFWVSSLASIGELMTGEVGETMRADERKFLDQVANIAVRADPVLVDNDQGTRLMMIHDDGGDRNALIEACRTVGAGLDLLSPFDHRRPPFGAIARIGDTAPSLPPGWRAGPTLSVTLAETDPAVLMG